MFIEDRIVAVKDGWRRLVDIESTEHGHAMLNLLTLQYRPHEICLGVGLSHDFAWYAHDVPMLVSSHIATTLATWLPEILVDAVPNILGCLTPS